MIINFLYHPKDVLQIYHKFDYKSEKSTLIICIRCALKKIWRQIRGAPWKYIHPKYLLLIYHKFDYKLEKSTLIICTRWLKEKISRQIKGALCKTTWEVACYFEYKFLNFDNQCFLIIQKMYYLYTTNLITCKKRINPYYLYKVAALKRK